MTEASSSSCQPPLSSSSSSSSPSSSTLSRLHTTVRLNKFTLRFEDKVLENAYQASIHKRKKSLWLHSLLPAATSQLLFAIGDWIEHPHENLLVTFPARFFVVVSSSSFLVFFGRFSVFSVTKLVTKNKTKTEKGATTLHVRAGSMGELSFICWGYRGRCIIVLTVPLMGFVCRIL
jgi:hypothetical protein